ncbi:hypothetical protein CLOP_g18427 [Closterium sp. NIES-67]|nr:hypothetical protein CLOP_g18427 [Closterium sp. NIES-67]
MATSLALRWRRPACDDGDDPHATTATTRTRRLRLDDPHATMAMTRTPKGLLAAEPEWEGSGMTHDRQSQRCDCPLHALLTTALPLALKACGCRCGECCWRECG